MFEQYNNGYSNEYDFQNSNLQIKYNNLMSKYENEKQKTNYVNLEMKRLTNDIETLCKSNISNEYNYNQLGGYNILNNMDIFKLIEFTNIDLQKQKTENLLLVQSLNKQIFELNNIITALKDQLTEQMLTLNNSITEDDINNSNIINNTSDRKMDVFKKEIFNMDPIKEKRHLETDIFGNIINSENSGNRNQNNNREVITPNNSNNVARNIVQKPVDENEYSTGPIFSNLSTLDDNVRNSSKSEKRNSHNNLNNDNNQNPNKNNQNSNSNKQNPNRNSQNPNRTNNNNNNNNQSNHNNNQDKSNNANSPTLTLENIDTYMNSMTEQMWDILEVIGTTGISTSNDLIDILIKNNKNYKKNTILNIVATLTKITVLTEEQISTGYRRFKIFKLSIKGEKMFESKFSKEPKESEISVIQREHDNPLHGYTIRDARDLLLKEHNCKSAIMDRKKISIKLPNGKTYIPDILAISKEGRKMYIEVELGNTSQADFNNKCNKMVQVTKQLYFVTDVDETMRKRLETQVNLWVLSLGGKEKAAGISVYITTMRQLSRGEWTIKTKY